MKNFKIGNQIKIEKEYKEYFNGTTNEFNALIVSIKKRQSGTFVKLKTRCTGIDINGSTESDFILTELPEGLMLRSINRGGFSFRVLFVVPEPGMILSAPEFRAWHDYYDPCLLKRAKNSRRQFIQVYENVTKGESGPHQIFLRLSEAFHSIIDPEGNVDECLGYAYTESTLDASDFFIGSDYCPVVKATGQIVSEFEI